jgi:ferredoxin-thioredoxin reductase catalytic subunit
VIGYYMEVESLAKRISEFAEAHALQIHPGQNAVKWAALVLKKGGGCPCVPGRNKCPCEESLEDIKEINRCRCGLYCNDAYITLFNSLTPKKRRKK